MRKLILFLVTFFSSAVINAQYKYRGQVISFIRQEPIGFGEIRLNKPTDKRRNDKLLAKIDSLGFFSFKLKDTSNLQIVVDCMLRGSTVQRIFYTDTIVKIYLNSDCTDYNIDLAKKDIEINQPYLLCHLGYATYHFNSKDSAFEKKYGVKYYTFADEPIWSDCMWLYNTTIAEYLDMKYGKEWREEVRWDVPFKRKKE